MHASKFNMRMNHNLKLFYRHCAPYPPIKPVEFFIAKFLLLNFAITIWSLSFHFDWDWACIIDKSLHWCWSKMAKFANHFFFFFFCGNHFFFLKGLVSNSGSILNQSSSIQFIQVLSSIAICKMIIIMSEMSFYSPLCLVPWLDEVVGWKN